MPKPQYPEAVAIPDYLLKIAREDSRQREYIIIRQYIAATMLQQRVPVALIAKELRRSRRTVYSLLESHDVEVAISPAYRAIYELLCKEEG